MNDLTKFIAGEHLHHLGIRVDYHVTVDAQVGPDEGSFTSLARSPACLPKR